MIGGNFSLQPAPYLMSPQALQHQQLDDNDKGEVAAELHFDRLQQDLLPSKQIKKIDIIRVCSFFLEFS